MQQAHVTNVPGETVTVDAVGALVVATAPLDDLVAGARARLSAFKVPTCWVVTTSADDVPMTATDKVDKVALQELLQREGTTAMTRAIDGLVNVDMGDRKQPDWMVRVKEDYFKGGDSFFKSPELSELLDDMDANGVERAILMTQVGATESRALGFVEARPDRFALAVGGFNLLKPMPTVRALESFVRDHPVAYALGRTELLGRRHVPAHRRRLLPALHQVLRARPRALHEHRHPRPAAARGTAEPDPPRPRLLPLPGAASCA